MTIEPAMLRPCYCGWTIGRVSVERGGSGSQGGGWPGKIRITCISCTASTGYCATVAEAIAAWNRRAPAAIVPVAAMTDSICTEGMRHAAEEDDSTGNHLQASYPRTGADEIDRLRAELVAKDERIAGLEAALRTWHKAFSQIPCWARKWDAFREARSAAKAALGE